MEDPLGFYAHYSGSSLQPKETRQASDPEKSYLIFSACQNWQSFLGATLWQRLEGGADDIGTAFRDGENRVRFPRLAYLSRSQRTLLRSQGGVPLTYC